MQELLLLLSNCQTYQLHYEDQQECHIWLHWYVISTWRMSCIAFDKKITKTSSITVQLCQFGNSSRSITAAITWQQFEFKIAELAQTDHRLSSHNPVYQISSWRSIAACGLVNCMGSKHHVSLPKLLHVRSRVYT